MLSLLKPHTYKSFPNSNIWGLRLMRVRGTILLLMLFPFLGKVAEKVDLWCRLPLIVIGRSNLIKMIVMPQILYIMHNSPVWVPMCLVHRFHHLFRELIWGKKYTRIKLDTLQGNKDGAALRFLMSGSISWPRSYNTSLAGLEQ